MTTCMVASSALCLPRGPSVANNSKPRFSAAASLPHSQALALTARASPGFLPVHARSSSSSSGSIAEEDKLTSSSGSEGSAVVEDDETAEASTSRSSSRSFSPTACQACGKEDMVGGCNGEGRILGGLGSVPGFGWFPIKAYRPCPAFVEAGGRYKRQGQSLEEVAFGRMGKQDTLDITERLQGGNKPK